MLAPYAGCNRDFLCFDSNFNLQPYSVRDDWIPMDSCKVFLVLLFCFHVLRLLHDVWNDAWCTHSKLPHCCNRHDFLPQLLELVLWFPHSANSKYIYQALLNIALLHIFLTRSKLHNAANSYMVEVILLGFSSSMDDIWPCNVSNRRQEQRH